MYRQQIHSLIEHRDTTFANIAMIKAIKMKINSKSALLFQFNTHEVTFSILFLVHCGCKSKSKKKNLFAVLCLVKHKNKTETVDYKQ